jgi:glycerophosphoryl diester phosphodiesterase
MVLILAHRGANRVARENTVAAFRAAAEMGADGVEFDVRVTADGVLVVHHDAAVAGLGPVAELQAASLPDWVPTLAEALAASEGFELVNVEVKPPGAAPARAVAEALLARPQRPRLLVSSFDLATVDAHRQAAPTLDTGWLTVQLTSPAEAVATVVDRGHVALHAHHLLVTDELITVAHQRGAQVVTWTVDDPVRAAALGAMGVDVVITNVPDALRTSHRPPT